MSANITLEELQLAARNHALPLEALRHPVTPVGLHYLLTHFDIPLVDPRSWRLQIGGNVERPLTLGLEELKERPARTLAVRSSYFCAPAHAVPVSVAQSRAAISLRIVWI